MQKQKILIPTLIVILVLVLMVVGATFAYFSVDIQNDSQVIKVNGNAQSVGNVSLSAGDNLKLILTAESMMNNNRNVNYYATIDGTPTTEENNVAIATAKVSGNGTMDCDYKINATIKATNSMYDAFNRMNTKSKNQLVLKFDGVEYDFYDTTFPKEIRGKISGINSETTKDILASFKVVNRSDIKQDALAGTDLTLSFAVTEFICQIVG